MNQARVMVSILTIVIPFFARIPLTLHYGQVRPGRMGVRLDPSATWFFDQYIHYGVWFWIIVLQIPVVVTLLLFSLAYRYPASLAIAAVPVLGLQAWAHGTLDISWNSTASVALIFIPVYTVALTVVTIPVGLTVDWYLDKKQARKQESNANDIDKGWTL